MSARVLSIIWSSSTTSTRRCSVSATGESMDSLYEQFGWKRLAQARAERLSRKGRRRRLEQLWMAATEDERHGRRHSANGQDRVLRLALPIHLQVEHHHPRTVA